MSLESLMIHRMNLQKQTEAQGTEGESQPTYANVSGFTNVPCRVQPASIDTTSEYDQVVGQITHVIYTTKDLVLTPRTWPQYRIVFESRNFEIQGIKEFDQLDRYWRLDCNERVHGRAVA